MITIFLLSLLVLTVVVWWAVSRHRQRAARARFDDIPLFAVPASSTPLARPAQTEAARRVPTPDVAPARATTPAQAQPRYASVSPTIRTRDGQVSTLPRAPRGAAAVLADEMGEAVDGESIRFWRPADGTLQFLPGRLEVASGRDAGQEIRFVRTGGPDGTIITFGRADGAPYRHVQLREPTVSRLHARMSLEPMVAPASSSAASGSSTSNAAPRWRIENLSTTNPVVVNGRPLDAATGMRSSVILSDGDRIEMGEVAFIFRAR